MAINCEIEDEADRHNQELPKLMINPDSERLAVITEIYSDGRCAGFMLMGEQAASGINMVEDFKYYKDFKLKDFITFYGQITLFNK